MSMIRRRDADSRFGELHYRIAKGGAQATGLPLLCLPQTPSNAAEWLTVVGPLAAGRTVIAVDTPGYGMSDSPPEPASIEDFAEIMEKLIADLADVGRRDALR